MEALIRVLNEPPLKYESTGAFGNRLHSLLSARWENLTNVEQINAIVLFRLISHDSRVERIALTNDIQTRDQFHKETRAFSCARRRLAPLSNNASADPEAKRGRPSDSQIKCYRCGTYGHRRTECHKRIKTGKKRNI